MSTNKTPLIDPTQYKDFLKQYIKDLYDIDAPMVAGAVERCLQKLENQPLVYAVEDEQVELPRRKETKMTPEEKIRELAEIVGFCIDSLLAVVPHNHRYHLEYLKERAEALAEEDAE